MCSHSCRLGPLQLEVNEELRMVQEKKQMACVTHYSLCCVCLSLFCRLGPLLQLELNEELRMVQERLLSWPLSRLQVGANA